MVIYVPGLNVPRWMVWTVAWLWADSVATPPLVVEVRTPWWRPWFSDLGTPYYVGAVREAIMAQPVGARIWLVGNSRGAGVVLKAADGLGDLRVTRVIALMGPYDSVRGVLTHRFGAWWASVLQPLAEQLYAPAELAPMPRKCSSTTVYKFITSDEDTSLSPEFVKRVAAAVGGDLLVLPSAPHSIAFTSYETKRRLRDFVWN